MGVSLQLCSLQINVSTPPHCQLRNHAVSACPLRYLCLWRRRRWYTAGRTVSVRRQPGTEMYCCAETGVQYRTVRWYKILGDRKETGVLFKALKNDSTVRMFDNFERQASLVSENSLDLYLPNVTAQDTGKYRCHLSAPVGERNVDGHVFLTVSGCPVEKEERDLMYEVIVCVSLVLALVICFLCWVCLRNISVLRSKKKGPVDQTLKAPLQKKKLKLIYTPGVSTLGPSTYHHVCV
ncbi:hypothetical protein AGOR_G00206150 [Albula goreensis]|uniref:Ig-like domain-containing protein n=1 Tax=Albula goreensis TaxID=1534307 RepID=A0A8T3CR14_9TELE|nr:hypothetical protein AGOR_G00206150 [Albula goreensis]